MTNFVSVTWYSSKSQLYPDVERSYPICVRANFYKNYSTFAVLYHYFSDSIFREMDSVCSVKN